MRSGMTGATPSKHVTPPSAEGTATALSGIQGGGLDAALRS